MFLELYNIVLFLWKPILEILVLWAVFYIILLFLEGTRALYVLKGLILLVVVFFVTQRLGLDKISWILTRLFALSVISLLIIFQPELRRGLARMGQMPIFSIFVKEEHIVDELFMAVTSLSRKKIGALIAIKRQIGLNPYIESGVPIDSKINAELISTIFTPRTPLHDGAIILDESRIVAAGCLLPLSQNPRLSKSLGTRHRAAIGLTEETDSICIIVSEETGAVSMAIGGRLTRNLNEEDLARVLRNLYRPKVKKRHFMHWFQLQREKIVKG